MTIFGILSYTISAFDGNRDFESTEFSYHCRRQDKAYYQIREVLTKIKVFY